MEPALPLGAPASLGEHGAHSAARAFFSPGARFDSVGRGYPDQSLLNGPSA
jgi:hypothetical protein